MITYKTEEYFGTDRQLIIVRDDNKLVDQIFNMYEASNKMNALQKEIDSLKEQIKEFQNFYEYDFTIQIPKE